MISTLKNLWFHSSFRIVTLVGIACFGLAPSNFFAQQAWYHYDGFTLRVNDSVRIQEQGSMQEEFLLFTDRDPSVRVQGYVLPFNSQEFSDALVIHLAVDLFYEQMVAYGLEGPERRIESLEVEHHPEIDHWAIRIENRTFTWYYYLMPITGSPGGIMSHIMLYPSRPDDPGLNDLLMIIEDIEIIIEDAAG
jgi:hypothetical protein